jgi:E3 ubiquitin-protein ligase TRIP12
MTPFADHDDAYKFIGHFLALCIASERTVELPLSRSVRRALLSTDSIVSSVDDALVVLSEIDPDLSRHIGAFHRIAVYYKNLAKGSPSNSNNNSSSNFAASNPEELKNLPALCLAGAPIEALCLDFTLPGNDAHELLPHGADIPVTLENLDQWVCLVCNALVKVPLDSMARGIRSGMSCVFDPGILDLFSTDEFTIMLCGMPKSAWSVDDLENIKTDHGYSRDSIAVEWLLSILLEFSPTQQRAFLRFVTGSSTLPVGGLRALQPTLTVVRKSSTGALPSSSTCFHTFKLPEYSSKEEMREKVLTAIHEGADGFHFS